MRVHYRKDDENIKMMGGVLMKKCIIVIIAVLCSFLGANMLFAAADTWTQKADFGGTARYGAVGFSIGSKGYMGTGSDGSSSYQERLLGVRPCRQYLDTEGRFRGDSAILCRRLLHREQGLHRDGTRWFIIIRKTSGSTTLPPIPGHRRPISGGQRDILPSASPSGARATSGRDTMVHIRKTSGSTTLPPIPGHRRPISGGQRDSYAVGFSIGSKGYIGTGNDGSYTKDFWEYDPAANTWTQKADFGGTARYCAVGFSIGSKGYIGTGCDGSSYTEDFWEYDPAGNTWTQKADFGGTARDGAVGFSIGSKGYIGTGHDGSI